MPTNSGWEPMGWTTTTSTTANTTSNDSVWFVWASNATATSATYTGSVTYNERTPEQTALLEEHEEQRRALIARRDEERRVDAHIRRQQIATREAEREAAHNRGLESLEFVLTKDEFQHYQDHGELIITASEGDRFMIDPGYAGNVRALDGEGKYLVSLCAHPRMSMGTGYLPESDAWITQILALKTDQNAFERIANANGPRYGEWQERCRTHRRTRRVIEEVLAA